MFIDLCSPSFINFMTRKLRESWNFVFGCRFSWDLRRNFVLAMAGTSFPLVYEVDILSSLLLRHVALLLESKYQSRCIWFSLKVQLRIFLPSSHHPDDIWGGKNTRTNCPRSPLSIFCMMHSSSACASCCDTPDEFLHLPLLWAPTSLPLMAIVESLKTNM